MAKRAAEHAAPDRKGRRAGRSVSPSWPMMTVAAEMREQTRARYPDETGFVERGGVRVFWERYGAGAQRTILFLPTWEIVHSRAWTSPGLRRTQQCPRI